MMTCLDKVWWLGFTDHKKFSLDFNVKCFFLSVNPNQIGIFQSLCYTNEKKKERETEKSVDISSKVSKKGEKKNHSCSLLSTDPKKLNSELMKK